MTRQQAQPEISDLFEKLMAAEDDSELAYCVKSIQLVASFGADFVQSDRTNPRRKTMSGTAC
jgi:hypothetical protein